jgi:hypothetical protein
LPKTVEYEGDNKTEHIIRSAKALRWLAANVTFPDCVIHQYVQSTSGRLYAGGLNLQSCPRVLRQAALVGQWDYDIASCHLAILSQMATGFGCPCHEIDHYVANKKVIRRMLAEEVGITMEQAKSILTMTAYGARASMHYKNAIPNEIGEERAEILYQNPHYKVLRDDIREAVNVVMKRHPKVKGRYVNAFRKAVAEEDCHKSQSVMAHLLQGVEAAALKAAIRTCRDKVVLLQHDGFTATEQVSVSTLEAAVLKETGYSLKFEEELLDYPLARFEEEIKAIDLKLKKQRKHFKNNELDEYLDIRLPTLAIQGRRVPPGDTTHQTYACDIPPVFPEPLPEIPDPFAPDDSTECDYGSSRSSLIARRSR